VSSGKYRRRCCVLLKYHFSAVNLPRIQGNLHRCPISYTELQEQENVIHGVAGMSKYEIIDCIMEINKTARQEFLAQFSQEDLDLYLEHLMEVDLEEIALCA
jgi:hypothetical protein